MLTLELELRERDGRQVLCSPEVGYFMCGLAKGAAIGAGEPAGVIVTLGRAFELRVPEGACGAITNEPDPRVRRPVGFGDVLYELAPLQAGAARATKSAESASGASGGMVLRSPQSGRFYHRPAPGEPAFVVSGQVVKDGQPVGMIEVMKTFSHVVYRATGGLPGAAKIARVVAKDGADVRTNDVLLELERAEG